jgi:hypothetical protein
MPLSFFALAPGFAYKCLPVDGPAGVETDGKTE